MQLKVFSMYIVVTICHSNLLGIFKQGLWELCNKFMKTYMLHENIAFPSSACQTKIHEHCKLWNFTYNNSLFYCTKSVVSRDELI